MASSVDSQLKSRTTVGKNLKLLGLEHSTDQGSAAGLESITWPTIATAKPSETQAIAMTASAQTMASHNITPTKAGNLISRKKNKGKSSNSKRNTEPNTGIGMSDEDNSHERDAVLLSPVNLKGKTSCELNKVNFFHTIHSLLVYSND